MRGEVPDVGKRNGDRFEAVAVDRAGGVQPRRAVVFFAGAALAAGRAVFLAGAAFLAAAAALRELFAGTTTFFTLVD